MTKPDETNMQKNIGKATFVGIPAGILTTLSTLLVIGSHSSGMAELDKMLGVTPYFLGAGMAAVVGNVAFKFFN